MVSNHRPYLLLLGFAFWMAGCTEDQILIYSRNGSTQTADGTEVVTPDVGNPDEGGVVTPSHDFNDDQILLRLALENDKVVLP